MSWLSRPSGRFAPPDGVWDVVLAGFGGQGLLLAGRVLATAALRGGLNTLVHNYYEGFVRGGVSECTVVVSREEVDSPVRHRPWVVVAMDERAMRSWRGRVRPGGLLLRNAPIVRGGPERDDVMLYDVPATQLATEVADPICTGVAGVGALVALTGLVPIEACVEALGDVLPPHRQRLRSPNEAALRSGASYVDATPIETIGRRLVSVVRAGMPAVEEGS